MNDRNCPIALQAPAAPLPAGNAFPADQSPVAEEPREEIREELIAETPPPVWMTSYKGDTSPEYDISLPNWTCRMFPN